MHTQTGNKVNVTLFLAFVRLPIYCVYTYFLNNILTFLSFFVFLPRTVSLHPPTKIPVLNDQLVDFLNCMHDVIRVEQKHTACRKNKYTCKLLTLLISGID